MWAPPSEVGTQSHLSFEINYCIQNNSVQRLQYRLHKSGMNRDWNSLLPTPLAEAPGQRKLSGVSEEINDALVK